MSSDSTRDSAAKPRTRDPDEKKRRILAAARQLFREEGTGTVKVAAIARAAGVSEGIVFHHFGSKRGLLAAVAAEWSHGLAQAIFESIVPGQVPSTERMVQSAFDFVEKNGKLHDFMVLTNDPGDWNHAFQASRAIIVAALEEGVTQYARAGWVLIGDPHITAVLVNGLVESAVMDCFVREEGACTLEYVREIAAFIDGALHFDPNRPPPDNA